MSTYALMVGTAYVPFAVIIAPGTLAFDTGVMKVDGIPKFLLTRPVCELLASAS